MRYVEWSEVRAFIEALIKRLSELPEKPPGVYGPPRGGLCLAVMLSHMMDIPVLAAPHKGAIIIDDISDSGETLLHFRRKGYYIATMFYKKTSMVEPDFWSFEKTNQWIEFPWEL